MTTSWGVLRRQERGDPQRVTFLELFFDLVFIFALTRLSQGLLHDLDWSDAFQTLILLFAVWWVWTTTTWATDVFDPRQPATQLLVIAIMLGSLLMATALPEAFRERGTIFATAYIAIQLGRTLFFLPALRGHVSQRSNLRILFWFGVSAVPWIAGAIAHGTTRGILWAAAVALEYTAGVLRWPTPGLGRSPDSEWHVAGEHLSERYRQFLIVALGELILVTGSTYSGGRITVNQTVALVVSFATTVLLWRIYIYRAGELLATAITRSPNPARLGRSASYTHLTMVAGIVVTAVGDELVIGHPFANTPPPWVAVIVGGPALFLAGRALLDYTVFSHVSRSRLIGLLVLAAMSPAMLHVPPLAVALATTLVLAGVAISNATSWRAHPREPAPP